MHGPRGGKTDRLYTDEALETQREAAKRCPGAQEGTRTSCFGVSDILNGQRVAVDVENAAPTGSSSRDAVVRRVGIRIDQALRCRLILNVSAAFLRRR